MSRQAFNIYCDESCHLEHDRQRAMVLGAIVCPVGSTRTVADALRAIKQRHGMAPTYELKWTKVSPAKLPYYQEVVDYFFAEAALAFRALVIPDKSVLDHAAFDQTHDDFYFKMYYEMLRPVLDPASEYFIYVDIKDTRSGRKTRKLEQVLSTSLKDFSRTVVRRVQILQSKQVEQLQLADLLIGVVSYLHRGVQGSTAKRALVDQANRLARWDLSVTSPLREHKVNLLVWRPDAHV